VKNILIIGASGGVGLESVRQALAEGHHVRAFARSADRIDLDHPSLEKRKGDALNEQDVASALQGIDCVIQSLGVAFELQSVVGPVRLFSDSTRLLVSAMEAEGVARLISVTGFGAGDSRNRLSLLQSIPFNLVLGRVYDDKDVQEVIIKKSKLDWIIVRPGILLNGPRTARYKSLTDANTWRSGMISRADVADFLIRNVEDESNLRQTPVLVY